MNAQWISFLAFRPTRVEADLGFVEYIVVAQHRGTSAEAENGLRVYSSYRSDLTLLNSSDT